MVQSYGRTNMTPGSNSKSLSLSNQFSVALCLLRHEPAEMHWLITRVNNSCKPTGIEHKNPLFTSLSFPRQESVTTQILERKNTLSSCCQALKKIWDIISSSQMTRSSTAIKLQYKLFKFHNMTLKPGYLILV